MELVGEVKLELRKNKQRFGADAVKICWQGSEGQQGPVSHRDDTNTAVRFHRLNLYVSVDMNLYTWMSQPDVLVVEFHVIERWSVSAGSGPHSPNVLVIIIVTTCVCVVGGHGDSSVWEI